MCFVEGEKGVLAMTEHDVISIIGAIVFTIVLFGGGGWILLRKYLSAWEKFQREQNEK